MGHSIKPKAFFEQQKVAPVVRLNQRRRCASISFNGRQPFV
jgi:hypothetical protein